MRSKISRRDFFRILKRFGMAATAAASVAYYGLDFEPAWLEVTQVEIPLPRLPKSFDGFRIVQISDIHIGGWMNRERLAEVLELTRKQKPDLVVVTGDFVFGHSWTTALDFAAEDLAIEMLALSSEYEVLGVLGNHDHWADSTRVRNMLASCKVKELKNDIHLLTKNGENICVAGLDDISENMHRMEDLLDKLPLDTVSILLAHEPDYADVSSAIGRFALQLSGHSHGGQVVIPFLGPLVLPSWARKYPAGLYRVGEMFLYTNRGVGMTSPFVRFNCRPEITVFTLNGLQ
jgi:predicted MPP superfamily phosphohydrolase